MNDAAPRSENEMWASDLRQLLVRGAWACVLASVAAVGCAAAPVSPVEPRAGAGRTPVTARGAAATPAERFAQALAALAAHDAAGDWEDALCAEVAAMFLSVADPPGAAALHDAAVAELRCDHEEAGFDLASRAAAADPANDAARTLVAHLSAMRALRRGDFRGAESVLALAIERGGAEGVLFVDLAHARVGALLQAAAPGRAALDLAIDACDLAVRAAPASPRAWALRAAVAMKDGRIAGARADLARAIALDPGAVSLQLEAASLAAAARDFAAADARYLAALRLSPDDHDVRLRRAIELRARLSSDLTLADTAPLEYEERYRAARDAIGAAIALDPSRPEALLELGMLLWENARLRSVERGTGSWMLADVVFKDVMAKARHVPALCDVYERAAAAHEAIAASTSCGFARAIRSVDEIKALEADAARRMKQAAEARDMGDDELAARLERRVAWPSTCGGAHLTCESRRIGP